MRPLLKFCGNHSFEDLQLTVNSRADFIGFIFTKKSRRTVSAKEVSCWLKQLGPISEKKLVGVFANDSLRFIETVHEMVPFDLVQLHGNESPKQLKEIKESLGVPVWKALHHDNKTLSQMNQYDGLADGFVIDTKVSGHFGGTGISFDWTNISDYTHEAERQNVPCFIAGGVTPGNISRLLSLHPIGIDIASGIERALHKDRECIQKIEEKVWVNGD
ncbi:phosphoribosylanthranilate isomerase [Sporolactobacillus nakayamae]|uniref:N-(5'-phosphoribosyl)anthranilate isomerase n=1 Tax=Sporolactobacillus nakayamae TaxID=269670 RepID=A0A1I2MVM4_9BACL|nr:phosphoribosylanthranilate isomerase [Sporolactobacillus nakayamae]SFF95614.1 phosphoribosylanthranilate isomerase [Sporolactobacillus nakayamae]